MKTLILFSVIVLFLSVGCSQSSDQKERVDYDKSYKSLEWICDDDYDCNADWYDDSVSFATKKNEIIEDSISTVVDELASFPSGNKALLAFLKDNIEIPDIARELGLRGKSVLQFTVLKDGSISQIKVIRGVRDCRECDHEAIRVIRKMPKWIPAKKNGQIVNSYFNLPVEFDY